MKFGNWPEELQETEGQKKRIQSAKSAKTTPSEIDPENQTGLFPGSGKKPYIATLESCTCRDFVVRRLPCKHMYRLGIELGLLNETAEQGINQNLLEGSQRIEKIYTVPQISLEKAVGELENLPDELQKSIKGFLYENLYQKRTEFRIFKNEQNDLLLSCSLLEKISVPVITALQAYKRKELLEFLDKHQISGFKRSIKHDDLIVWCMENIADIWSVFPEIYTFQFSDHFDRVRRDTYRYLRRKYDLDSYYDEDMNQVVYPHGAVFENVKFTSWEKGHTKGHGDPTVFHFPDDKITKLLTLYGHNRCLNGFDIQENRKILRREGGSSIS